MQKSSRGFTLIELSMVMAIIALLVGGVLAAQNLLQVSRLRTVYTDVERYINAMGAFQDKYNALPGDIYNAESIWGTAGGGAACATTDNGNRTTCSGNGNEQVELGAITGADGNDTNEIFRFWQHLSNDGLIEGKFSGIAGGGGANHALVDVNVPRSAIEGAGFTLHYQAAGGGDYFTGPVYDHILHFGLETAAGITDNPIIPAVDALSIDLKIDDGKPGTGRVLTYINTAAGFGNCASTDVSSGVGGAEYLAGNVDTGRDCNLIFVTGY